MSMLPGNTYFNRNTPIYALAGESASNWYNFPSLTGEITLIDASGSQVLKSIGSNLYFNNQLLAQAGQISNVADWSLYPALSTVQMNDIAIVGASDVQASTVHTSSLISLSVSSSQIYTSSINAVTATIGTGLGGNVTIASGGITANGSVSAVGLATTSGLNMTNTGITNTTAIGISANGFAPYGSLSSPDGVNLTWNGASIVTGGAGAASNWSFYPQLSNLASFTATQISTASLGVSSINGSQFPPPAGDVTQWALNPALSTVQFNGLGGVNISSFTGVSSLNGVTYAPTQQWSGYFATGDVVMDGNTLQGGTNKPLKLASGACNVQAIAGHNFTADGQGMFLYASTTVASATTPTVKVLAKGGPLGGLIQLQAEGGASGVNGYGEIDLNAYGTVAQGGLITLNAYSGVSEIVGLTSAIRAQAASIGLSAGVLPALPGLAGSLSLYGTGAVSMTCGLPGILPQVPGTVYTYGLTGVTIESPGYIDLRSQGTYAQTIFPSNNGSNLVIRGRTLPTAGVDLMDVEKINMVQGVGGQITAVSSINYMTIEDASLYRVSTIQVSSINGVQFPQTVVIPSTFTDFYASTILVDSIGSLHNSSIFITAPVGEGLILAGDLSNGGFLDINNQSQISTQNFAALGNDLGGVYIGGNANTNFSLLALNPDGVPNADLTVPRGSFNVNASSINISSQQVNISTANLFAGDISGAFLSINNVDPVPGLNFAELGNDYGGIYIGGNTNTNFSKLVMNPDGVPDADLTVPRGSFNVNASTINISSHQVNISSPVTVQGLFQLANLSTTTALSSIVTNDAAGNLYKTPFIPNLVTQYNYWVAINGNNATGNGSISAPYASISGALAATAAISDSIPVNINIAPGTYTENPTITRNNTFLIGPAGVSDVVIVGTLSLIPGPTAQTLLTQGANGLTIIGSVICSETVTTEVGWYLANVNVTSYSVAAVACTGDTTNNCSITLNQCILTQNVTTNACLLLTSCRANLTLVSMAQNTTAPCVNFVGNSSIAANGATFTSAGAALASPIIFFSNNIATGSLNTFTSCSFIYTASTAGIGKTGISFSNAVAANAVINYCIFSVGGSTNIIIKNGIGTTNVSWGHNTCTSVSTVPATSATLTYSYSAQDFIRANTLRDSANSAGTGGQVLTSGSAGSSLTWTSLGPTSLGALAQTPSASTLQNSLMMYNTTTNALSYAPQIYSAGIVATGTTIFILPIQRGRTFILTGTGTVTISTAALVAADVGFFANFRNGNGTGIGDITLVGATVGTVAGNLVIRNQTISTNGGTVTGYWTGTVLQVY